MTQHTPSEMVVLFKALSDPTRLGILQRLRLGERCVCDLQDGLDAAQSRLSFHLRVLKDAGLVTDRRDGRWVYYAADGAALVKAQRMLASLGPPDRQLQVLRAAPSCV